MGTVSMRLKGRFSSLWILIFRFPLAFLHFPPSNPNLQFQLPFPFPPRSSGLEENEGGWKKGNIECVHKTAFCPPGHLASVKPMRLSRQMPQSDTDIKQEVQIPREKSGRLGVGVVGERVMRSCLESQTPLAVQGRTVNSGPVTLIVSRAQLDRFSRPPVCPMGFCCHCYWCRCSRGHGANPTLHVQLPQPTVPFLPGSPCRLHLKTDSASETTLPFRCDTESLDRNSEH